jgi:hypothetical protein
VETRLGSKHASLGGYVGFLAGLLGSQGRYAEAEALYKRALSLAKTSEDEEAFYRQNVKDYIVLLRRTKRKAEARALEVRHTEP